jgi:hypothetical protein
VVVAFLIAEGVPFFNSLISLIGALVTSLLLKTPPRTFADLGGSLLHALAPLLGPYGVCTRSFDPIQQFATVMCLQFMGELASPDDASAEVRADFHSRYTLKVACV